jgi:DNA-binding transcriptional MerR regulator
VDKSPEAFRTISEVADELKVPKHVLRFWEAKFAQLKPMKRGGGRRYYRPEDVDLLRGIRHLLYGEGYTIRGVQRILKDHGTKFVQSVWQAGAPQPAQAPEEVEGETVAETGEGQAGRGLFGLLPSLLGREDEASSVAPEGRRERRVEEVAAAPDNGRARVAVLTPAGVRPLPVRPAAEGRETSEGPAASSGRRELSREHVRTLQETMFELIECRRLIDAALAGNS